MAEGMPMEIIKRLLTNRNFIFLFALAAGAVLYPAADWTKPLILPALALAMTLSAMAIPNSIFRSPRSLFLPALAGILMNYLVLGNFLIFAGALFVEGESLWQGLVLMAAVPPAVAVIPFAYILKGDNVYALIGTVAGYLSALMITPLIMFSLLGTGFININELVMVTLEIIVLPFVLSRIFIWKGWDKKLEPFKGTTIDWSFFVVLFTIIGLNRQVLVTFPLVLLPIVVIAFTSTFLLGLLIEWVGKLFRLKKEIVTSLMLLGTLKNYGLAGGLALTMFAEESALPAALGSIFLIFYILWLDFKKRWD